MLPAPLKEQMRAFFDSDIFIDLPSSNIAVVALGEPGLSSVGGRQNQATEQGHGQRHDDRCGPAALLRRDVR